MWFACHDERQAPSPLQIHVVVETEHQLSSHNEREAADPIQTKGFYHSLIWFSAAAQNQPTSFFTSNSTPSRSMKKHALLSLFASALIATTFFVLDALR